MNAMGHKVKNFIGLARADLGRAVDVAAPTAMAMGTDGMADMAAMSMPLPTNTLPMMTGTGPFGGIEMGGMFSVVKVREGLAAGDYRDPGWYKHPAGTVAHEVDVAIAGEPARAKAPEVSSDGEMPGMDMPAMDMPAMKSGGHHDHH
jgi:hypothetical protein